MDKKCGISKLVIIFTHNCLFFGFEIILSNLYNFNERGESYES